jgi:hypothetical protein
VAFASVYDRFIGLFTGRFFVDHKKLFTNHLTDSQASNQAANLAAILAA